LTFQASDGVRLPLQKVGNSMETTSVASGSMEITFPLHGYACRFPAESRVRRAWDLIRNISVRRFRRTFVSTHP
jgi:hypothetical protein